MVQVDENISVAQHIPEPETLLKKYNIPLDHLDFKYLETCKNPKEIENIVKILRSGQEGYFPDLTKYAEERLVEVNPNSKLLYTFVPVLSKHDLPQEEWKSLSSDLEKWINDANKNDQELSAFHDVKMTPKVPVRESMELKNKKLEKKSERIRSMDYDAWDKLDVDTEILKMEIKEEKIKEEALKKAKEKEKLNTVVLDPDLMTKTELNHAALQSKLSGNESYKLGDYEDALQYYTNSLLFLPSAAVYNNRAITNIKLKNYKDAIEDCREVLKIEKDNEKAYLRKSTAHKYLKEYDKAMDTLEILLHIHPNSVNAQNIIRDIKRITGNTEKGRTIRMKIEEHGEKTDKKKEISKENKKNMEIKKAVPKNTPLKKSVTIKDERANVLVSIPSTSSFPGPFYKVLNVPIDIARKLSNTKITRSKSDDNVINLNLPENRIRKKIRNVKSEDTDIKQIEASKNEMCNSNSEKTNSKKDEIKVVMNKKNGWKKEEKTYSTVEKKVKFEDQVNENIIQNGIKYESQNIKEENRTNGKIKLEAQSKSNTEKNNNNSDKLCFNSTNKIKKSEPVNEKVTSKADKKECKNIENGKKNPESSVSLEFDKCKRYEKEISKNFTPFEFLKYWKGIKNDPTLQEHEILLRALNPFDLVDVVGNKLDGDMLSLLLKCLVTRFTKENDMIFIQNMLSELYKIPRINIIMLFMDKNDKMNIESLISRIQDLKVQERTFEIYSRFINF